MVRIINLMAPALLMLAQNRMLFVNLCCEHRAKLFKLDLHPSREVAKKRSNSAAFFA